MEVSEGVLGPQNMSESSRPGSDSEDSEESVESYAHVAPQDERLFQENLSYVDSSTCRGCLAKIISEIVSLLQHDATLGVGDGERGVGGSISSEESVSISIPDSHGQRAILPSKITPSE